MYHLAIGSCIVTWDRKWNGKCHRVTPVYGVYLYSIILYLKYTYFNKNCVFWSMKLYIHTVLELITMVWLSILQQNTANVIDMITVIYWFICIYYYVSYHLLCVRVWVVVGKWENASIFINLQEAQMFNWTEYQL